MDNTKINIRDIFFDNVTLNEATDIANEFINSNKLNIVYTPNSEIVQLCIENTKYYPIINEANLIIPDGVGVVLASKVLGTPLKCKVAGIELGENIISLSNKHGYKIFFLGGKPNVAELATEKLKVKYPNINICGMNDGYFNRNNEENDLIIAKINKCNPDILFVCLGAPSQEIWIHTNKDKLHNIKLCLGLGGSLDGYAGTVKRAPKIFIKFGLEWFYRLLKEPYRLGRMMKLPKFLFGTIWYKITRKEKAKNER